MKQDQLKIAIIGIGGAGTNMINRIIETTYSKNFSYISISTSKEELNNSKAESKLLIGQELTKGLGTFGKVDVGIESVNESKKDIINFFESKLKDTNVAFLVTGIGGGTGTGATSLIAKMIRKMGIVTISVVTTPFVFKEEKRNKICKIPKEKISKNVDLFISIPFDTLFFEKVKSIEQTFQDLNDSVRQSVQEMANYFLSYNLKELSYEYLREFILRFM